MKVSPDVSVSNESEVNKLLSAYKSEGNPEVYKDTYADLVKFVENSLDIYKVGTLIYLFVEYLAAFDERTLFTARTWHHIVSHVRTYVPRAGVQWL